MASVDEHEEARMASMRKEASGMTDALIELIRAVFDDYMAIQSSEDLSIAKRDFVEKLIKSRDV